MATFADEVFPDKLQSRSVHSFTLFSYKLSNGHTEILSAKLEAKKVSEDSSTYTGHKYQNRKPATLSYPYDEAFQIALRCISL